MGNFITLAGVNPPSTLPRVDLADSIMPDAGALFLIDPAHPVTPWAAGVPANNATVPNVAGAQAAALIGSQDVHGTVLRAGTDVTVGRTARGGFRVDPSSTAGTTTRYGAVKLLGPAFAAYVHKNWNHSYYLSTWVSVNRAPAGSGTPVFSTAIAENSGSYLADLYLGASSISQYPQVTGDHSDQYLAANTGGFTVGTPRLSSVGVKGYTRNTGVSPNVYVPAQPASSSGVQFLAFGMGKGLTPVDTAYTDPGAAILYRAYLEDLTVSGRNYAQVQNLDAQLFTAATAPGGRYAGDTYTAP